MSKILFIVGSLRQNAFNSDLAKQAEYALDGRAEISYLDFKDLPLLNQDIEWPAPASLTRIREEIKSADAIWIFSPVYNNAIPGVLKNLIDWVSRSLDQSDSSAASAIHEKIVTISSIAAAEIYSDKVANDLSELMTFIRTQVTSHAGYAINPEAWATGQITLSEDKLVQLKTQADDLLSLLNK